MKTADLIKKKEEEKTSSLSGGSSSSTSSGNPFEGKSMGEARMAGNNVTPPSGTSTTDVQATSTTASVPPVGGMSMAEARMAGNGISLYQDGVDKSNNTTSQKVDSKAVDEFYKTLNPQDFGVETEEQKKARERRDFIKQGLTGFTEGLSALANLYYTTKGAPSQTLVSQMPELSKRLYAERLERDKKLENFRAWQRAKAEKDADRAYQEKVRAEDLAFRQDQAKENLRRWQLEFDEAVKRNATQEELRRLELNLRQAQQEFDNTVKQQTLAETKRHNIAMETNAAEKISGSSTGSKKGAKMATINTPKGAMDVDFGRVNETTLNQLYQRVPKDVKAMYELDVLDDDKVRQSKMRQAIDHALQSSEGFSDWFQIAGLGSYQKTSPQASVTKQQPKTESKGSKSLGDIGFIKSTKSNANAAPLPTYTETANVSATEEAVEAPTAPPIEPQGSKFDRLKAKYAKEDADEKEAKNLKLQKNIADMEAEIRDSLNMANEYQKELDELNKIQMLDPRKYSGSRKREVEDAVNEAVSRKKYLEKEIKELKAKAKNLNKEYEKLYPYKK